MIIKHNPLSLIFISLADVQQIASQPDAGNDQAARSAFANVERQN